MSRFFSVLFLVVFSIAVARAQEPLVIKPESCSSLIKTANSLAHYQSELFLGLARFSLHCGNEPRFHAYQESKCTELEDNIATMKKVLSVCAPLVQTSIGAAAAGAGAAAAVSTEPVSPPPFKSSGG